MKTAQAATVIRIFEMTAAGYGLSRVSKQLSAEGVLAPERLGPKGIAKLQREGLPIPPATWCPSGVREILTRELYKGIVVEGRVKRGKGRGGRAIRIRVPEAEWKRRPDETLRVVSDDQWNAAHAQTAATSAKYLRQGNKLVGKAESLNGRYLLSAGLVVCGATTPDGTICGATLHAIRRGRNVVLSYVCQAHRERGSSVCSNSSGVPAHQLHAAVITSLKETFNADTFEAHLKQSAEDETARASRAAERAAIIDRLPVLVAQEERLAEAVATGDGSVSALVAALKARQQERLDLESRLAELETWERDAQADQDRVEQLRERWGSWQGALDEDPVLARQLLKKVLGTPIYVRPVGRRDWVYVGIGRYDLLLKGAVASGEVVAVHKQPRNRTEVLTMFLMSLGVDTSRLPAAPIAGGSDAHPAGCKTPSVNSGPSIFTRY